MIKPLEKLENHLYVGDVGEQMLPVVRRIEKTLNMLIDHNNTMCKAIECLFVNVELSKTPGSKPPSKYDLTSFEDDPND
mgnify:CR=1 FL=1